jgi:hypothetical protein
MWGGWREEMEREEGGGRREEGDEQRGRDCIVGFAALLSLVGWREVREREKRMERRRMGEYWIVALEFSLWGRTEGGNVEAKRGRALDWWLSNLVW